MEWASAARWSRRPRRTAGPAEQRVAADALEALRVGVLVVDETGAPVLANSAAFALGLVREEDSGPQVHAVIRTLAERVRRTGARREVELDIPQAGEPLGVRVRAMPLGGRGYPAGHVAVEATDVTEAHRVARVRRDFVANVSHELKTPVGALALLAETLLEAADDAEASRRFAQRIHSESQRLARLVKELLELSRLQGADPLPSQAPVAVDRIVNEAVDRTRTAAAAKHIDVHFPGTRGLTVYGSEGQLVTAVANLVENAIAYSPDETKVSVSADLVGDMATIAVADQGIGIATKDQDRIFERFYRTDQARSRDTGGTGLGLAIVKHIVVNHGGRVEVASSIGVGSTFTLWLPVPAPDGGMRVPTGLEIDAEGTDVTQ